MLVLIDKMGESTNAGKSSELGKHDFEPLYKFRTIVQIRHVIIMRTSCFDSDFASQMKLTKPPLIHCFGYMTSTEYYLIDLVDNGCGN